MKLQYDETLSNFALNFNLRRYNQDSAQLEAIVPRQGSHVGGSILRMTGTGMPNTEVGRCRLNL